jgi:ligand-binding sensor protein
MGLDITDRKRAEEALEKRIVALTRPLEETEGIAFEDLFNLEEIQRLHDQFAHACGVASIITHPDGTPITKPSNFCRLCEDIIRRTDKGIKNCYYSDSVIGRYNSDGPTVQPCLSGGLWDAGTSIGVGGRHIANWLIGQVRNETQKTMTKCGNIFREIDRPRDFWRLSTKCHPCPGNSSNVWLRHCLPSLDSCPL